MNRRLITAIIALTFFMESAGVESLSPVARTKEYTLRPMATGVTAVLKILDKDKMSKKTEEQVKEGIVSYYRTGRGPKEGDYLVTTIMPGKTKKISSKKRWAYFPFRWLKSSKKKIDVVFIAEKDLNRGRVLNCYRCYHSEGNILLYVSKPLATFKYLRKKKRNYRTGPKTGICTRIGLAASDIFDYYHGRGDIKPVEGRRLKLDIYYSKGKKEFVARTSKGAASDDDPLDFSLWPVANKKYKKNKKHQTAYAEIKQEQNYGPYIEIYYEEPKRGIRTVLSTYYDLRKLLGKKKGRCRRVDFSKLAFTDYGLGNKNVYGGEIVPPEEYYHPGRVDNKRRVEINYKGRRFFIRRLTSLIDEKEGKIPVFIRKEDERYGYKFYVHDAAEYEKDKTREPEHILVRDVYSKTLVLIERVKVHQARELIDKGLYLSAISVLEDYLEKNPKDTKAREYYNRAKRLHEGVLETLKKPKSIKTEDRFDFYLRVLADSSVGKDDENKKRTREEALTYFRGIKSASRGKLKRISSRLIELLDFGSSLVSQVPINIAIMTLLFELPAEDKTLSLASKVAEFIEYRGPFQKELESAGMRFFNSILDEDLRRQLIEEKREEWKELLEAVLQKKNLLSERGKVENIKALEWINVGIFEDNGLLGIYNFYIASRFIRDEKPGGLTFSHFILYKLGLITARVLEEHTGIPRDKLEAIERLGGPNGLYPSIGEGPRRERPGMESRQQLLDFPESEVLQRNGLLTEVQRKFWRPKLLQLLKQRDLLDENEKIKNLDAFLSIDSMLFTTSTGKNGVNALYLTCSRLWTERFSKIPKGICIYHIVLKEFSIISFNSCVGYCREALNRKNINAAIEVFDVIKTLYAKEIKISYEYAASVERLENSIAQLGKEISELALAVITRITQLCYDWKVFLEEDSSRSVKEIKNFLDDFKERIRVVKERNSEFKEVLGKGEELGATYKEAISDFLELMKQFLRLRRALKKANVKGDISKQDIADALRRGRVLIQKEALSRRKDSLQEETLFRIGTPLRGKRLPEKEGQAQEDTELSASSDDGEGAEDGEDKVPSYEPDEAKEIRRMVSKMPDIEELVEYEEALIDAEVIVEYSNSPDDWDLYTLEETKEAFERLLAPGFLDMLELESDIERWHETVRGLKELLPAEVVKEYDYLLDFLDEKKKDDAFGSAA